MILLLRSLFQRYLIARYWKALALIELYFNGISDRYIRFETRHAYAYATVVRWKFWKKYKHRIGKIARL